MSSPIRRCSRPLFLAALVGLPLTISGARADLPPVFDRVAEASPVVISIRNIDEFNRELSALADRLGPVAGEDLDKPIGDLRAMAALKGVRSDASAAVVVVELPAPAKKNQDEDADEMEGDDFGMAQTSPPKVVLLVPVTAYKEFVEPLGGKASEGVTQIRVGEAKPYVRDLGNGYALVGDDEARVKDYASPEGQLPAHAKRLGPVGMRTTDDADVLLVANVDALGPVLDQAIAQAEREMQAEGKHAREMGMPEEYVAGQEAGKRMALNVMRAWRRDATCGVGAVRMGEAGLVVDAVTQFRGGSESAGYFDATPAPNKMLSRLPSQAFLFAAGLDTSSPGAKKMVQTMETLVRDVQKAAGPNNPLGDVEMGETRGSAFVMGATPDLGAGLFTRTAVYIDAVDSKTYLDNMRGLVDKVSRMAAQAAGGDAPADGKEPPSPLVWKKDAKTIADTSVDQWGVTDDAAAGNPGLAMVVPMLFGQSGIGGFVAATDQGVVGTLSPNSQLMSELITSARTGKGLGASEGVAATSALLQPQRSGEMYLGTREILSAIEQVAAMFGGVDLGVQLPEKINPIGLGLSMDSGGVGVRVAVPTDALESILSFADQARKQREGADDPDMPAENQPPKF